MTLVTFKVAGVIDPMSCVRGAPLAVPGLSEAGSVGLGVPGRAVLGSELAPVLLRAAGVLSIEPVIWTLWLTCAPRLTLESAFNK